MSRLLNKYVLFTYTVLFSISLNAWSAEPENGILWQVSKSGQQSSYLLGTIHSDAPAVTTLPAKVSRALEQSSSFTAELDLDLIQMLQVQMQMLLPENKSLQSIIGDQRFKKAAALMATNGVPAEILSRMKPWAVAAQLSMPKSQTGIFLDLKLFQMAKVQGKKTYGLETMAEQLSVFDNMTDSQQIAMLDQAIKDHAQMQAKINTLIRLYVKRDLNGMKRFSDKEMKKIDPSLSRVMEDKLINERNHRMVKRMQPQLKAGKAFIAVGSLHLPGEQGILKLLQKQGYQVKAVY
ncbi:hypothetical protein MNBD_GAMMA21-1535 [hydrothermal vent metagenome]|uniref:TraB/GumN family protein n=1 Tax=hydrothermal vent metagenome TaxID=652676 RepID=A0A3B1A6L5_9ZZZZ